MRGSSAEGWKSWLNRGNTATSRLPASMLLSLLLLLLSSCVLLPAISYNSKPKRIYPSARSQTYSPSCFGTTFHLRRGETKNLSHEQADLTPAYERARVRPVLAPQATTRGRTEFQTLGRHTPDVALARSRSNTVTAMAQAPDAPSCIVFLEEIPVDDVWPRSTTSG